MRYEGAIRRGTGILSWTLILMLVGVACVLAQDTGNDTPLQTQQQTQQRAEIDNDGDGALQQRLQQRFEERINAMENCDEATREQMRQNLRTCLQSGLQEDDLKAIFKSGEGVGELEAGTLLRLQARVVAALMGDLPPEPLLAKVREGRLKGVSGPVLEQVVDTVGENLEQAQRLMNQARQRGFEEGTHAQNREMIRTMARVIWQGVDEKDCDQLMIRARDRLRDGSCSVVDYVSGAETVAHLMGEGIGRDRALETVGEALRLGYQAGDLRRVRLMLMADGDQQVDEVLAQFEDCLGEGTGPQYMYQHMEQYRHMTNNSFAGPDAAPGGGSGGGDAGGPGGTAGGGGNDDTGGNDHSGGSGGQGGGN